MSQFANTASLLSSDYFELFGLPRSFAIDLDRLERDYRALQSRFHPDRFASASDADRRLSLEISTHINGAYLTLRRSLSRARYLLTLVGMSRADDDNAPMPAAFLMRQMELRESMDDARRGGNASALTQIRDQLCEERAGHEENVARLLEQARDFAAAAECVRMLGFYESLSRDVDRMIEVVEDAHAA
jgi:molecular chaperone HscB